MSHRQWTPPTRAQRYSTRATAQAAAPFTWEMAPAAATSRHRSLRYATTRASSGHHWRAVKTTTAYRARHSRRAAHSGPDFLQTLKSWFSPPRVRVAKLRRGVVR
jgi:hypothetical protein